MTSRLHIVLPCVMLGMSALFLRGAAAPATDTVIESQAFDSQSSDTQTVSVFTGNVTVTGNDIRITGTIPATLSDFKIDPPSLLAMPVKNDMPIRVEMTWRPM